MVLIAYIVYAFLNLLHAYFNGILISKLLASLPHSVMKVLRGRNTSLASKFFCLALLTFLYYCVVPTSGFITDIYEDHTIEFKNETLEINHTVNVHENATLTIQPGASIKFSGNGSLNVYGNLVANGTEALPIDIISQTGKYFNRSLKTLAGLANSPWNIFHASLRLVDGNGYNTGRLEILHQGIWGTICDDGWSQINSDVACRELGFQTGTFTRDFGAGTGQIWMDDVRCTETDRSLRQCSHLGFGSHNCAHWQDVGLICTGLNLETLSYNYNLNLSSSIFHFASKERSSLINVRIHVLQEDQFQEENSSLRKFSSFKAIFCDGECPYLKNANISGFPLAIEIRTYGNILLSGVKITDCLYGVVATNNKTSSSMKNDLKRNEDVGILRFKKFTIINTTVGVLLVDYSSFNIELEEIAITGCHTGVQISQTIFTRLKLSKIRLQNGVNAIRLRRNTGRFELVDLCDSSNDVYNESFPVEITHYNDYHSNPCSMVFATSPGQVLSAFVSDLLYVNLRIRDSNSSELLFELSRDNLSQQYIVELKSNAVIVEIEFEGYWYSSKLKMFLLSRPESSQKHDLNEISEVTIQQFTGIGISLDVNHYTTIIRNSDITNTSATCISAALGQGSTFKLINSTFEYNDYFSSASAMLVISLKRHSLFQLSGNKFHNNHFNNILRLQTANSELSRDNLDYILKLTNNTFQYNANAISATSAMLIFSFNNNDGYSSTQINGNIFQSNHYDNILKFQSYYYYSWQSNSRNKLSLLDNRLFNNTAKNLVDFTENNEVVVIRGNTLLHNAVERSIFNLVNNNPTSSLNFTRNSLIANYIVHRRSPRSFYDTNDIAAVICLSGQMFVNENFFENPFLPLEFILSPNLNSHHIDGKMNWWGSTDENDVIARIFDFRHRNYLPRLTFSPFLASANLSDVFKGETNIMFRKGNVLGGLVTEDIILEKDNSPFIVTRDVIILPNATLTIQAGVQVNVFPDIGFHVYGKFELLGELSAPIKFGIPTKLKGISNFGHYPTRLVNGSKPWEGVVEILYNNTWGTICDNSYSYAKGIVLCKQLGFESYSGSYRYTPSSGSAEPVWWRNVRCDSDTYNDIASCSFQGWGVSCYSGLWTVRCNPGFWRGIRFRETAKASQISHVNFERGGGYTQGHISRYVLHFDVLRQVIRDVEIHESFGGIKITFQSPDSNMTNIRIQNRHRDYGNGIETSSSLTCYNCSIFNKDTGVFIDRIDIQSFIDDSEIRNIDSILPDIVLRKEILICEQNREITIGREDMQIITPSRTTSYSSTNVECIFNITLLSEVFLTTVMKISDIEELTITASKVNSSKSVTFNDSHSNVYKFGPGYLTVRYWRKAYSSGTVIRMVIVSTKGNEASLLENEPGTAILVGGSLVNNDFGIGAYHHGGHITYINRFKLQNVTLKDNFCGIYSDYHSTNISLDSCTITDGYYGIYIHNYYYWNYDDLFVRSNSSNHQKLENCIIRRMRSSVIFVDYYDYYDYRRQTTFIYITFHRCIIRENERIYDQYHWYYNDASLLNLYVSECSISQTNNYGFEIHIPEHTNLVFSLSLDKNLIFNNSRMLLQYSADSVDSLQTPITIRNNIFVNNSLPPGEGLIYFYGKRIRGIITNISNNTFTKNKCSFMIKVDVQSNQVPKIFMIKNNILEHNEGVPSNNQKYVEAGLTSYAVGLFGCMFNLYDIHGNIFNNEQMKKELFVGRTCGTNYLSNTIDATLNYWGTSSRKHLTERIFHFDNWSDRPRIKYLPAAATRNFTAFLKPKPHVNLNQSQIGGYVHSSLYLTAVNSPYVVMNDLIISQNATLDIEPGVQLYFKPHIGLLVFGNIIAPGTTNEKITFCSLENKCKKRSQSRVRLFDGDLEHQGKVEVLVDGTWQGVCFSCFSSNDGTVACRQLGFGRYINHYSRTYYNSPHYNVSWNCRGNETSLLNCKNQSISNWGDGLRWGQNRYYGVILECERNFKWGGVRIIHQNVINSTGYGEKNEKSILRNILIHDAGILHEEDAPSIQVIRRSPSIAHVDIRESNGIKIISQTNIMALENVNVESGLKFPAISILGNKGSVSISRCSFKRGKQHGIAISPIKNITFMSYLGHNLCNSAQKVSVDDESYIYLSDKDKITNIFCGLEILSPKNTTIHFRLLSWVRSSYTVNVYNGDRSSMIANIHDWNVNQYEDKVIVIPSNSGLIEADISTLRGFLAEITVIGETGRSKQMQEVNVNIEECNFQEISGSAVHYTSDPELASTVTIKLSHVTLQGNNQSNTASIEMLVRNNDMVEISNTVFSGVNRGGIHIYLYDKPGVINIINNVISGNVNGSESVYVVAVGNDTSSELLMAGNYFDRNDISYPHGLVVIKNMNAVAKNNVFYQNNAETAFNLVNSKSLNTSSTVTRNVFRMNRGHLRTLLIQPNGREMINENSMVNPTNLFELSTLPSNFGNIVIDATNNWWGNVDPNVIMMKIKDNRRYTGLPRVIYQPFLWTPTKIFSTGLCPFDWIYVDRKCYKNLRSAHSFTKSKEMCKKIGGKMLAFPKNAVLSFKVLQRLHSKWAYGTPSNIWIDFFTQNDRCWMFDGILKKTSCDLKNPTICEKSTRARCINDCSLNGVCVGQTCECNSGWEGADCSLFHCKDVGNCGTFGTCVGANHCKCRIGWKGRGCTVSYCLPFRTCQSCLSRRGCGWCDNTRKCLPGTGHKADIGHCKSWFYHNCISVGRNPSCSSAIKVIDCSTNLCNFDQSRSNKGSCQQCKDLERCYNYNNTDNSTSPRCYGWDERKCAKGFVQRNYEDTSRIDKVVTMSNVKLINSDDLKLYGCPVEEGLVIVTKQSSMKLEKGDIISSTQAEGVFHKIEDIAFTDQHVLMSVIPATLEEAISYSDFNQEVPLQTVLVQDLFEDRPDDSLLQDVLSGDFPINETKVHSISTGSGNNVYKCLAKTYTTDDNEEVTTFFMVISMTSISGNLNVGHVLVGNSSDGFLETVTDIIQEEYTMFVYTELTTCNHGFSNSKKYKSLKDTTSSCLGGDDLLGLKIVENGANVTIGDIIVGRESDAFFGKVLSFYTENENYFVELMPLISVKDGNFTEQFNISDTTPRRQKRARFSSTTRARFRKSVNKKIGQYLKYSASVDFNPGVKISLYTSFFTPKSVGITFFGNMELNLNCNFDPSASYSKTWSGKLVDEEVGRFCIPIIGAVCVPGVFRLNIGASAIVSASASASLSTSLMSKYSISAGGEWYKGHGVRGIFNKEGSTQPSFKALVKEESASVSAFFTPTFEAHWPSVIPRRLRKKAAWILRKILGGKKGSTIPSLFVFKLTAPLTTSLNAKFCTEKCPDSIGNIEATFRGGLPKISGSLTVNIGSYNKNFKLFGIPVYENVQSKCFSTGPVKVPCCIKNGKPGKIDPKTKDCEEECDCIPGDSSSPKGVKMPDGSCKCEMCPDNSVKRKRSGNKPECPCLCKDNTEKEMNTDGSCPCSCSCEDGTEDTIAWDGSCPCKCSCEGFLESTRGPFGCKCEEKCPVCEDGEEPVWIDQKCKCRKKFNCGVPPVCVTGRKGPNCQQPDCWPCQGCSGNGFCVTDSSCRSRCLCRRRWQGRCCERRRPVRWWGDPHLQTLDGVEFDYFGIGEFWNCKSITNDFGMQIRFFGYKGASLTGAVALKVAENVVTITTQPVSSPRDLPMLRVNGALQNFSGNNAELSFANDSIKLNIFNPENRTESNGAQVIIMAFQYKSGVTVSVEVEYSPVMSRHYLNVNFIPNADFTKATEGLCGFMDDDETNDLIGPNGEQYNKNDTIQFAESWRITASHDGSGQVNSWNWNSSNFHAEDVMDSSYTNEEHKPLYTLDSFSQNQVEEAKGVCNRNGLENTLLDNCVFDILMTNDTSFAEQQSLQIGCPNDCTGKGLCLNATCRCLEGWSGDDCTIGSCGNCSRGSCVEGFCKCDIGWEGAECDRKAACFAVDNCTSEVHGICKTTDVCECNVGFTGPSCATIANCYNVLNCSSNGVCIGIDECKCDTGYSGASCNVTSCESLGYCSGNGRCIAFDTCECVSGWSGPSCSIPDCDAVNQCSKKGECVGPNHCNCFGGYQGADCSIFLDCSHLNNCTDNGVCIFNNDVTGDTNICSCFFGFVGSNCSQYDCSDVNDCSGNGTCVEPNLCSCNMSYEGEMCLDFSCQSRSRCSGNGICVGYEECQCNDNWMGLSCETPTCYDMNNCSSNGQCVSPNKCECFEQYDGENCTEEVSKNLNTPTFTNESYFAAVSENRGKGFVVLSVYANDTDHGRSGEVLYIIEDASLASFFMVNQDSGEISVFADDVLDYETLSQKQFTFTVTATDNGVPSRSSEATVTITVQDENDNCPVIGTLPGKYKLPVDILASDADYGNNGQIQYSITEESDPYRNFFITSHGRIFPNSTLEPGEYSLTVVAQDGGVVPCAREVTLTVVIDHIVSVVVFPTSTSAVESNSTAYQQTPSLQTPSKTAQIPSTSSIADVQSSSHFITSTRMKQSSTLLTTSIVAGHSSSEIKSSPTNYQPTQSLPATSEFAQTSSPPIVRETLKQGLESSSVVAKSSSLLSTSIIVAKVPSPSSQTSAMTQESSSLFQTASLTTSLPRSIMYHASSGKLEIASHMQPSPTSKIVSTVTSTQLTPTKRIVTLRARLLNYVFVASYRDKNSSDYKNLRGVVEKAMINIFEKMTGFLRISDVDFDEGSVIANIQTEFSSENKQVSSSSLARAVADASDDKGNLDKLRFDKSLLLPQIVSTTPKATVQTPSKDEDDERDRNALIGATAAIGGAGFICLVFIPIFVCYFKKKRNKQKISMRRPVRIELNDAGSYVNHRFDSWYEE